VIICEGPSAEGGMKRKTISFENYEQERDSANVKEAIYSN
jgi:hypothetical protein